MVEFKNFKPPVLVSRFCCCSLITGNLIVAWLNIILYVFAFVYLVSLIFLRDKVINGRTVYYDVDEQGNLVEMDMNRPEIQMFQKFNSRPVLVVYSIFFLILTIIAFRFTQGVNDKDPKKMKAYVILQGISLCIYILHVLITVHALLPAILQFYFYTAAYSLYLEIKSNVPAPGLQQVIHTNRSNEMGHSSGGNQAELNITHLDLK